MKSKKNLGKKIFDKKSPVKEVKQSKAEKKEAMVVKADRLVAKGKDRGFVTYDEILREFPTVE